ncbi:mannose-6-phosphate isomerase [Microbacteriaceae bacterium SG_E_30_P1]|uniref:mannose-6-phosphate isomerase n=1 Tax=Antiquaquibacter oligotrophicus TaxID=2880260 RepID=A0ABT6KRG8_9MICO|nr:mannose-6-phosphate isomerase, class I [Antiquaquibacter oligotrophicus]MDH6181692.1 mannose-6-phosphate isomerase [Antiquaquibacter oligotrophicus]UDF12624.1 mannose-6-phosphate isomerase, class I [Antiquaquibacter oligotrophicus]
MFVGITNEPRDYAWGSDGLISELLGREPSGAPEAELWLGAHHGSPSVLLDPGHGEGAHDLAQWIAGNPTRAVGNEDARLPFLLKVLAAASPLSLQAHPTTAQAQEGFTRENAAGIPLSAAERNYRDPHAKPELILAVSDRFEALCGFRPIAEVREDLEPIVASAPGEDRAVLADLVERLDDGALRSVVEWLITRGDGSTEAIAAVSRLAETDARLELQRRLAELYPGDPGIVISLLLHHVVLARGEALFLPAGNIHAYVDGVGIELMEASDNVLRGGLTPKHVDVAELLSVLDFTPRSAPLLIPEVPVPDVRVFRPEGAGFALIEFEGSGPCPLDGPAIALCLSGSFVLSGATSTTVSRGDAVFITPDEGDLIVDGSGQLVVATVA